MQNNEDTFRESIPEIDIGTSLKFNRLTPISQRRPSMDGTRNIDQIRSRCTIVS